MLVFFFCASPYCFSQENISSKKATKPTPSVKGEGIDSNQKIVTIKNKIEKIEAKMEKENDMKRIRVL